MSHRNVTSGVSRGLYSFYMETLLEGDSSNVFGIIADLCKISVDCGLLPLDASKAAVDEFCSFVVERGRQHVSSDRAASSILDVLAFLLGDFSFQARRHVLRVFKLFC